MYLGVLVFVSGLHIWVFGLMDIILCVYSSSIRVLYSNSDCIRLLLSI